MNSITVTILGDKPTIAKLKALGPKLNDFSTEFAILGPELINYYSGVVFASEGGVLGKPWKSLSKGYAGQKVRKYPGRGILVATGSMQRSFREQHGPQSLYIDNTASYFKYHQSTEPRKKIPRRPMLEINDQVESIVKKVIQAGVERKITGA